MSDKLVPTLSGRGWLRSPAEKVDQILSWFYVSDYSQSELFRGNITSFAYLVQRYGSDKNQLTSRTESTLESYFKRYLPGTIVEVTAEYLDKVIGDGPYQLNILLRGQNADGSIWNYADKLEVLNSTFKRVMQGVNTGIT